MTFSEAAKTISKWRQGKGFYTPSDISICPHLLTQADAMLGKLFLVASELAEAGEAVRDGNMKHFTEEIADTFIRPLDICGTCGIDIEKAINDKMAINEKRPVRHGRKTML